MHQLKGKTHQGLVNRHPNTSYSHGYFCETTEFGKKVYAEIHEKGDPLIEERFSLVSKEELKRANETLMTIWEHIY